MLMVAAPLSAATFEVLPFGQLTVYTPVASGTENLPPSSTLMSATLASPLNTGSTVPALTPVTVPCNTPTCAHAPAVIISNAALARDFHCLFISAPVAGSPPGGGQGSLLSASRLGARLGLPDVRPPHGERLQTGCLLRQRIRSRLEMHDQRAGAFARFHQ